jgi:Fe-S cluster biogenesis protein NfuA
LVALIPLTITTAEIAMATREQLPDNMQRMEELIQQVEAVADPGLRGAVIELVQLLLGLHGRGISRMLEIVRQTSEGSQAVDRFSRDEIIGQLLMLHDLHPVSLESRVAGALDKVRPMLQSHGGDVELLGIEDGVVRLRLDGNCDGCPSSSLTLKNAIESAIYEAAADIAGLEVTGVVDEMPPANFVSLDTVKAVR